MLMVATNSLYGKVEWGWGSTVPMQLKICTRVESHHLWPCPFSQSQSPLFYHFSFSFVVDFFLHP